MTSVKLCPGSLGTALDTYQEYFQCLQGQQTASAPLEKSQLQQEMRVSRSRHPKYREHYLGELSIGKQGQRANLDYELAIIKWTIRLTHA